MMSKTIVVLLAIGALGSGSASVRAQYLPAATPESVGLSSERPDEATRRLQSHVDAGDIAGVVAAVVRHGRLAYLEALGELDRERGLAMSDDALFRLYSMTRPITSLAAMFSGRRVASRSTIPSPGICRRLRNSASSSTRPSPT